MCPKLFPATAGKLNHYWFYLPNLLKFATISHINYWDQGSSWKVYGNCGMTHIEETSGRSSMLPGIGR